LVKGFKEKGTHSGTNPSQEAARVMVLSSIGILSGSTINQETYIPTIL